MRLAPMTIFRFACGRCGADFEAPELTGDFGYGELLARSEAGTMLFVDALGDPAFDEVGRLARQTIAAANVAVSDRVVGGIVQQAFSLACDPDVDGSRFVVGARPKCPECGSSNLSEWRSTDRIVQIELAEPTHHEWSALGEDERESRVREAVFDALSE